MERGEGVRMDPLDDVPAQISAEGKMYEVQSTRSIEKCDVKRVPFRDYVRWLPKGSLSGHVTFNTALMDIRFIKSKCSWKFDEGCKKYMFFH